MRPVLSNTTARSSPVIEYYLGSDLGNNWLIYYGDIGVDYDIHWQNKILIHSGEYKCAMERGSPQEIARETLDSRHSTILFDGVCNLCDGFVQFVIERDNEDEFRFAPLQSDVGQEILNQVGCQQDTLDSIVLVEGTEHYTESSAVLRIVSRLGTRHTLWRSLLVIPPFIRDRVYNCVANNRYRLFGKQDQCMLPTPEIRAKFLVAENIHSGGEETADK